MTLSSQGVTEIVRENIIYHYIVSFLQFSEWNRFVTQLCTHCNRIIIFSTPYKIGQRTSDWLILYITWRECGKHELQFFSHFSFFFFLHFAHIRPNFYFCHNDNKRKSHWRKQPWRKWDIAFFTYSFYGQMFVASVIDLEWAVHIYIWISINMSLIC